MSKLAALLRNKHNVSIVAEASKKQSIVLEKKDEVVAIVSPSALALSRTLVKACGLRAPESMRSMIPMTSVAERAASM